MGAPSHTYSLSRGSNRTGTTRLATTTSFAFFARWTWGSLGTCRALESSTREERMSLVLSSQGQMERPWLLSQGWTI